MDRLLPLLLLVALAALFLRQAVALSGAKRARAARRASALDLARPLLDVARLRIEPGGLPRLAGEHGGRAVDLRLVADTLTTRKLPALWLMATLTEPMPLAATWHLMLRPRGDETFSAFGDLPTALPLPRGLPEDAGLRTDHSETVPEAVIEALAATVARLGSDRLKEVVLSPKGLRLTWLAEEADRGRYLILREADLAREPIPEAEVAALLDALHGLARLLAAEPMRRIA